MFYHPTTTNRVFNILFVSVLLNLITVMTNDRRPLTRHQIGLRVSRLVQYERTRRIMFVIGGPLRRYIPLLQQRFQTLVRNIKNNMTIDSRSTTFLMRLTPVQLVPHVTIRHVGTKYHMNISVIELITGLPNRVRLSRHAKVAIVVQRNSLSCRVVHRHRILYRRLNLHTLTTTIRPFRGSRLTFTRAPTSYLVTSCFTQASTILPRRVLPSKRKPLARTKPTLTGV